MNCESGELPQVLEAILVAPCPTFRINYKCDNCIDIRSLQLIIHVKQNSFNSNESDSLTHIVDLFRIPNTNRV